MEDQYRSSSSYNPSYLQNYDETLQPSLTHPINQMQVAQNDQLILPPLPIPSQNQNLNHHHSHQIINQDDDLDHLLAELPYLLEQEQEQQQQAEENTSNINPNHCGQRRRSPSSEIDDDQGVHRSPEKMTSSEKKKKQRMTHREAERQRRLEMSSLHASLRTLLPLDYIKGKRSMSDHIDVAGKYIQHVQQRIKALSEHRDALKLERESSKQGLDVVNCDYQVSVNPWNNNGGVEVIVCCGSQGVPLSKVLQCLNKQGLDVVNCLSNEVNHKLVHTIQAQVASGRSDTINLVELQQNLNNIRNFI